MSSAWELRGVLQTTHAGVEGGRTKSTNTSINVIVTVATTDPP